MINLTLVKSIASQEQDCAGWHIPSGNKNRPILKNEVSLEKSCLIEI
jgi:hypothetical protein